MKRHGWIWVFAAALASAPPAFATGGGAPAAGPGLVGQLLFFIPLILIFYFLLTRRGPAGTRPAALRPAADKQQRKRHQEMVAAIKRGDTVVTSGGLLGKVTKVGETELTVELAEGVRGQVIRSMVADVRSKDDPVAAND